MSSNDSNEGSIINTSIYSNSLEEDNNTPNTNSNYIKTKDELSSNNREVKVSGGLFYSFVKRTFDILSSGLVLLLFGWFILLLMLIKLLEDIGVKSYKLEITENNKDGKYLSKNGNRYDCKLVRDPNGKKDPTVKGALYTSLRVGKNGKIFKFHKIRSMCPGAESMKAQLLEYGINEADEPAFKLKDDPRITKFGKFIRKTSLDELPQIWDIFIGKMSVVGPRSPIPSEVEKYSDYQKQRFLVKGGLLCLWQIEHNRNNIKFDDWIELDLKYIEHRSIWLDTKILFKGAWMVLFDKSGE